ncbi:unnamed protein product [Leptidea sinapis]|uniref:Uncharacterized protein n=1 Tax=Leptidea sinapis TaxID=189913 RepID=A0A5E4QB06_9NEOP|nr:unnamed protein product [Leptidea sinapis]
MIIVLETALAEPAPEPAPGRIPKVYNALITSNQNLEPSKAFPVYQPVLHNAAFPYPIQPVYLGDLPLTNPVEPTSASSEPSIDKVSTENPPPAEPSSEAPDSSNKDQATEAPPSPPKTEAPIPLNEFGLPPQVIPLGRFGSGFEYTQINTFPYSYPGLRFYNPYDAFGFHPYTNFPIYNRPFNNYYGQIPLSNSIVGNQAPAISQAKEETEQSQPPSSESGDLNILNYSSKDPAIPNVPPPPLPQGGLKPDKE